MKFLSFSKRYVFILVLLIIGGFCFGSFIRSAQTPREISGNFAKIRASETERLIIYTRVGCSACDEALKYFQLHSIPYHEREITASEKNWHEFVSFNIEYTPLIIVNDDRMIVGFNPDDFSHFGRSFEK